MKARRILSVVLLLAMVFSLTACGGGGAQTSSPPGEITGNPDAAAPSAEPQAPGGAEADIPELALQCGFITTATSSYVLAIQEMSKKLQALSGGKISIVTFPDGQLGGETELLESVSMGAIDMCVTSSSPIANYVQEFFTFDMPYLVTDLEVAHAAMDSELGRNLLDKLTDIGIYGMAFWDNGFRHLTTSSKEVSSLADVKGLKIRVMENEVHQALWTALGAYPTPMSFAEVITSLEQGTIDGQENPLNAIYSSGVYEVQKNVILTGHVYTAGVVSINQDLWDSLSDNVKALFQEALDYATQWERDYVAEDEADMVSRLEELGLKVTEIDTTDFAAAVTGIYDTYASRVYTELVEALRGN